MSHNRSDSFEIKKIKRHNMFSREFYRRFPSAPFPRYAFWAQAKKKKLVNVSFWRNVNIYRVYLPTEAVIMFCQL